MNVCDVLLARLKKCGIEDFVLDAGKKTLEIGNKSDFDAYLKRFPKAQPQQVDSRQSGAEYLPYGATHWASFSHRGWTINGNIIKEKPDSR